MGPRCQVCVGGDQYYDKLSNECEACPSSGRSAGIFLGLGVGAVAVALAAFLAWKHAQHSSHVAARLLVRSVRLYRSIDSQISLQVKAKIFLGFIQVRLPL